MEYVLDTHCHTIASGHAYSTIEECAAAASAKGMKLLAITDHGPKMPGSCHAINFVNLKALSPVINGVEVLPGVEANIMDADGKLDLSPNLLGMLRVVIASLHGDCFAPASEAENTRAVVSAVERYPSLHIVGHLADRNYPVDLRRIVRAAAEFGKIIEINDSSLVPGSHRYNGEEPHLFLLRLCAEYNVPVVAASDAHFSARVGDLRLAKSLIERSGIPDSLVLNHSAERLKNALNMAK